MRKRIWGVAASSIGTVAAIGAGTLVAAVRQTSHFTLRRREIPVLAPGAEPFTLLHISDLHLVPTQRRKIEWVKELAELQPDLVISTGDHMADSAALPSVLEALEGLLDVPGAFVLGSNDYFAPILKNPLRYFLDEAHRATPEDRLEKLPTPLLIESFEKRGWLDLTNARAEVEVRGTRVELVGLDDPHIDRDEMPAPREDAAGSEAGASSAAGSVLRLGVVHAPYRRALDALYEDGAQLILAGHTHGGQVGFPTGTAIVANCDIDRRRASGLNGWPGPRPDHQGGEESAWLHVSAGLGNNPYTPVRLFVPPEATLITLNPQL